MGFAEATKKAGESDEWYTPESAVYPLLPYIKPNSTIWCPFDDGYSAFFRVLSTNFRVIATHINTGNDFFTTNIEKYDYIISNPPYSIRQKVLERLFDLKKPFAMLLNYAGLWDSKARYNLFKKNGIELLILEGRTKFIRPNKTNSQPLFQSIYVCHNMLPERIVYQ